MEVFAQPGELREQCLKWRGEGLRIGFVPTMGALHEGHLSLVQAARDRCDKVVASIFVNPLQFAPSEDLEQYPRDAHSDGALLEGMGVDVLFHPTAEMLYPQGHQTRVCVAGLSQDLCGAQRPGHFEGVTTVVMLLFQIVQPHAAFFGKKDYQQWRVVERMTRDLHLPVTVHGLPIIREPDGLAMSSRNAYLDRSERARALVLWEGLQAAKAQFSGGERRSEYLERAAREILEASADEVDYVELRHGVTLEKVSWVTDPAVLLVAARVGATRLIDNLELNPEAFAS